MIIYESEDYNPNDWQSERMTFVEGEYEPFVYMIRVVDQDKLYIGMKVAKGCLAEHLGTKYFTSSKIVVPIWKECPENIEILFLQICKSNHDAIILEGLIIDEMNAVSSEDYLNQYHPSIGWSNSGHKGHWTGKTHSDETKQILSYYGKLLIGDKNPFYGKSHNEETKQKLRDINLGKVQDEETKQKISESLANRKFTDEHRNKISEAAKKRVGNKAGFYGKKAKRCVCDHCGKNVAVNTYARWHGNKCKYKYGE